MLWDLVRSNADKSEWGCSSEWGCMVGNVIVGWQQFVNFFVTIFWIYSVGNKQKKIFPYFFTLQESWSIYITSSYEYYLPFFFFFLLVTQWGKLFENAMKFLNTSQAQDLQDCYRSCTVRQCKLWRSLDRLIFLAKHKDKFVPI